MTPACREKLDVDALRARRLLEEFGRACREDVDRHCRAVEPGGGRVLNCLAQQQLELAPACEDQVGRVTAAREQIRTLRSACAADLAAVCPGTPPQAGAVLECLRAHEGALSPGCNNPQFVFGASRQFAFQVKAPVLSLYPSSPAVPAQSGLGDVVTALSWRFAATGPIRHYASFGVQWETAAQTALGAAWAVVPAYAVALGLARWVSLTTQVV